MRFIYTLLFIFASLSLFAQSAPPSNLTGATLRTWLKDNWYTGYHTTLGYDNAREQMYGYVDKQSDGDVYCVYTGFHQDGSYTTYPNPINCEHSIPQSWFNEADPMVSDLFHLYPTHQDVNSARGSLPFDEITDSQTDSWYIVNGTNSGMTVLSSIPSSNIDGYSELNSGVSFEPREVHCGNLARSAFYFYTMYPNEAGPIANLADVDVLYAWHLQDPVDATEIQRNNRIEDKQGNRNPYIDYPQLVCRAWSSNCPVNIEEIDTQIQIYPSIFVDRVFINSQNLVESISVYDMTGKLVFNECFDRNEIELDLQQLNTGLYMIVITDIDSHRVVKKVVKN